MRAVFAKSFGGDDPLANLEVGEVEAGALTAGTARIRVSVAALNHHDLWTLRGVSSAKLVAPQVLGCDAVGTIAEFGPDTTAPGLAVGDRVVVHAVLTCGACSACRVADFTRCPKMGLFSESPHPGTLAETLVAPVANLVPLPSGVEDRDAACLPTAYLTAYRMLFVRGGARPGMSVLVQGASGGVATAAILLARAAGLTVFATARTEAKRRVALDLGALRVFDSQEDAVFKQILGASEGGVDCVIETVGEPTWDLSLRSARSGGTIVVSGTTGGPNPPAQLSRVFWKQLTIAGSSMGTRDELERVVALCASGGLSPLIDSETALADAPDAFAKLAAGEQRGKLLIRVSD